jgi:hypothetical protein
MTYASTINFWLKHQDHFMGCFKSNNLSTFPKSFPQSLIVNINESEKVGHFVAILLQRDYVIYFDSLGFKHLLGNIKQYLKSIYGKVRLYSSMFPLQHNQSIKCAHFCTVFILHVKSLKDFKKYLNIFSRDNLWKNDNVLDFLFAMIHCHPLK